MGIALAFGGSIPLFSAFIARNFGPAHLESNIGMTATVFIFAGFAGPYAGGCLHDAIGSYTPAILMAGAIGISGILAAMQDVYKRQGQRQQVSTAGSLAPS